MNKGSGEEIIEQGEYIYGVGAHGGVSEVCYLARTRAKRKAKLRARGLVFDEATYIMKEKIGTFFCLQFGHHFRANIDKFVESDKTCPYCSGERAYNKESIELIEK